MAFKVGDEVLFQGVPGEVVKVNTDFTPPLNLVLIQQPVVRWVPDSQLTAANVPPPAQTQPAG